MDFGEPVHSAGSLLVCGESMAKKRRKRRGRMLIWILAALLVAVAAVIAFKMREYAAGAAYYEGLRGLK